MASKYELIKTMWYKTREDENSVVNSINYQLQNPESGYARTNHILLTTGPNNPNGSWEYLGKEYNLSVNIVNIEPIKSTSPVPEEQFRKITHFFSLPNGQLIAEGTYYNPKNTSAGAKYDYDIYDVTSGSGIFKDANIIIVSRDKDGSKFGKITGRRVEVYKLKPKTKEEIIPDFSGIWEDTHNLFGNLNGKEIPLDKPLEIKPNLQIKQNGRFVEIILIKYPSEPIPERPSLLGVLEPTYNENLKFIGWKLIIADSTFDNGSWSCYPTKMENNVVMEYKNIYIESGFQKGNSTQTPIVGYGTVKRILNYDPSTK